MSLGLLHHPEHRCKPSRPTSWNQANTGVGRTNMSATPCFSCPCTRMLLCFSQAPCLCDKQNAWGTGHGPRTWSSFCAASALRSWVASSFSRFSAAPQKAMSASTPFASTTQRAVLLYFSAACTTADALMVHACLLRPSNLGLRLHLPTSQRNPYFPPHLARQHLEGSQATHSTL